MGKTSVDAQVHQGEIHTTTFSHPDSITAFARKQVMQYFQSGDNDSVELVISRCDTSSHMKKEWLSGHERVLIAVLQGNLSALKKPEFYCDNLSLRDTITSSEHDFPPPRFDPYRHDIPAYDNLSLFLQSNFRQKLVVYRSRFPEDEYLWNFLDIIFDPSEEKIIRYMVNYAGSPFAPLVRFNYYQRYEYQYDGVIIGAGYSFVNFEEKANALYQDRAGFTLFAEGYKKGFFAGFNLGVSHKRSQSTLFIDHDTVTPGTSYRDIFFDGTMGHLISLHDRVYLCPYAGAGFFKSTPTTGDAVSIPMVWGASVGIAANVRLSPASTRSITSRPMPDVGIRIDAGYHYRKFYRIRSDLGTNSFYVNISLEMIRFAFRRAYTIP